MAVFTAPPGFTVLHGREIGGIDPVLLIDWVAGPRLHLLGGRSWCVTWTDWKRRRCFVEPAESGGRARWLSDITDGVTYELARSMRQVLLGTGPPVPLTRRAAGVLAGLRSDSIGRVNSGGTVIGGSDNDLRWWTSAGDRANATLKATLGGIADESQRVDDLSIRLHSDLRPSPGSANRSRCHRISGAISAGNDTVRLPACDFGVSVRRAPLSGCESVSLMRISHVSKSRFSRRSPAS